MGTRASLSCLVVTTMCVFGCSDDQDAAGAADLWNRIQAQSYQSWARPPNYETVKPSFTLHADKVEIFLDPTIDAVVKKGFRAADGSVQPGPLPWPDKSIVVKRAYSSSGKLVFVAAMEKRDASWRYYEWDPDGKARFSGRPSFCVDCHAKGADEIWSFTFPRR